MNVKAALGRAGILVLAARCSSGPSGSSGPAASLSSSPVSARLTISVKVVNTHYGTAIPSDFPVALSRPGTDSTIFQAGAADLVVDIPIGAQYAVTTTTPLEGYTTDLSSSCSGVAAAGLAPCVVTHSDIAVTCDDTLWSPVYIKDRLRVLAACETATGSVDAIERARDGDLVLYVKPDLPYQRLLRPGNDKVGGRLVVEVPCQGSIVQREAEGTCDKFQGKQIRVPEIGTRIIAAAHWVEDRNHYLWGELHGARVIALPR
jgi:hypothetical protein